MAMTGTRLKNIMDVWLFAGTTDLFFRFQAGGLGDTNDVDRPSGD